MKNAQKMYRILIVMFVWISPLQCQQVQLDAAVTKLKNFNSRRSADTLQELLKAYDALTVSAHKTKVKNLLQSSIARERGIDDVVAQQFREKFDSDALKQEKLTKAQQQTGVAQKKIAELEAQLKKLTATINTMQAQADEFARESEKYKGQIRDLTEGANKSRDFSVSEREQMAAMITAQKQQLVELGSRLAAAEQRALEEARRIVQEKQTGEALVLAQTKLMVLQSELAAQTAANKTALAQLDTAQKQLEQTQQASQKSAVLVEQLKKQNAVLTNGLEQTQREIEAERQKVRSMSANAAGASLTPGPEIDAMVKELALRHAEIEQLRQQVTNLQGQLSQQVVAIIEARAQGAQGAAEEIAMAQEQAEKTRQELEARMRELDDLKRTVQTSTGYVQGVDTLLAQAQAESALANDRVQELTKDLAARNQELAEARRRVAELDAKNSYLEIDVKAAQRTAEQLAAQLAQIAAEKKLVVALTAANAAAEKTIESLQIKVEQLEADLVLAKKSGGELSSQRFAEAERIVAESEQVCASIQADKKQALRDRDMAREALAQAQGRIKELESLRGDAQEAIRLLEQKDARIKELQRTHDTTVSNMQQLLDVAVEQTNALEAEIGKLRAENTLMKAQGLLPGPG